MSNGVEGESHGLIGSRDRVGWHVITPFCLDGGERHGDTILINRGWVQNRIINPAKRREAQIEETIELEGVIRKTEQRQQKKNSEATETNRSRTKQTTGQKRTKGNNDKNKQEQ